MSPRRPLSYSDNVEVVRPSRPMGHQRGPTTDTVLGSIPVLSDGEKRAASSFATATAARQGWESDGGMPLADVLAALGLTP